MAFSRTNKKKQSQLIPILFTLGVIGWGFFAIDRLTNSRSNDEPKPKANFKNISRENSQNMVSFLQKAREWILARLLETKNNSEKVADSSLGSTIPVVPGDSLKTKRAVDLSENTTEQEKIKEKTADVQLYFYKADRSDLRLHRVNRKVSLTGSESIEEAAFRHLFAGPTGDERLKNFLDSFPDKPKISSVKKNGARMVINFKTQFGKGLSHQMVRSQLRQLFETAKQFEGVSQLSLSLNHKPLQTLGGDGLVIPEIIDRKSWLLASSY